MKKIIEKLYNDKIQLGPKQVEIIAKIIYLRKPKCRMLVFGCGHDSLLWAGLNSLGKTLFLETKAEWRDKILKEAPRLDIRLYEEPKVTVASCLKERTETIELPELPPPPAMLEEEWDIILIDGPEGYKADSPGRALPIKWSSEIRKDSTHIFLDDYARPLEKAYGDKYLDISAFILRENSEGQSVLAWDMGKNDSF